LTSVKIHLVFEVVERIVGTEQAYQQIMRLPDEFPATKTLTQQTTLSDLDFQAEIILMGIKALIRQEATP